MTTYYLVVHKDFEYNDEYHENHDGYKIDSKLIKSKEEANKIAEKKNKKAVKEEWYTDSWEFKKVFGGKKPVSDVAAVATLR